jgi:hypothetical protein
LMWQELGIVSYGVIVLFCFAWLLGLPTWEVMWMG